MEKYIKLDNVELIQGDCLIEMNKIPDKSIDMILCDLPYEVLNKGNKNATWDRLLPFDKLWEQYNRIIKDNGAIGSNIIALLKIMERLYFLHKACLPLNL